jgi:Asp/Glu/hydantoin racemase
MIRMKTKTLALIHTVSWFDKSIIDPFITPWLKKNPDVRVVNIMDDSLLAECLDHHRATQPVLKRIQYYVLAAEAMGANVVMCSCTTVGEAICAARYYASIPVFNIDEPMAREAVRQGRRLGIVATVPTSPAATRRQLERAAQAAGVSVEIKTAVSEKAFDHLQRGEIKKHNELVHREMDRLAKEVDVLVLGQISLAQIEHPARVPVLQVAHSGLAEARRLLDGVDGEENSQPSWSRPSALLPLEA